MKPKKTKKANVNTPFLISLLEKKGISQRFLAKKLNIDPSAVFHLLRGTRRLMLDEVSTLAEALGMPIDEVTEHFGVDLGANTEPSVRDVKVEGWLDGTLTVRLDGLKGKKVAHSPFPDRDIRALRAQTSGTEFDGLDGALFFYKFSKLQAVDPECVGKLCLVKITGEKEFKLRVMRRSYNSGRYDLCSLGGKVMEESVRVEANHPVVWMKI